MSAGERFLARWSRLKRGAAKPPVGEAGSASPADPAAASAPQQPPPADPAPLPPLEAIDAQSDVQRFLAPDVPPALARAALRRAWSADPAIRDFIGLSENSWDFAAPGGVPGFAALDAEQARRLLAGMTETRDPAAPPASRPSVEEHAPSVEPSAGTEADRPPEPASAADLAAASPPEPDDGATHPPRRPRRHGGALPQ
jgi:hypothetical protein